MALEVRVVTPERRVWSGDARLLVARGVDGEIGVMGGHAPLLVRLAVGPLRVHTDEGEQVALVDGGFLHVSSEDGATRADVLAAYAEMASEIDGDAARRRAEDLRRRLGAPEALDDVEAERLRAELRRAEARVALVG